MYFTFNGFHARIVRCKRLNCKDAIVITKKLQSEAGYLTEQMNHISRRIYRDMEPEEMKVLLKLLCQVLKNLKSYHQNHRTKEESDHDYDSETNQAI